MENVEAAVRPKGEVLPEAHVQDCVGSTVESPGEALAAHVLKPVYHKLDGVLDVLYWWIGSLYGCHFEYTSPV